MAGKNEQPQALEEAYKEGKKEAAATAKANLLEKSYENVKGALGKTRRELARVASQPHMPQILVTAAAAGAGGFIALKVQSYIKDATKEWVETEGENIGESTVWRKLAIHGTFPILGLGVIALGLWVFGEKGTVAAGCVGLGSGMLFGSLFGSLLIDDEDEDA